MSSHGLADRDALGSFKQIYVYNQQTNEQRLFD